MSSRTDSSNDLSASESSSDSADARLVDAIKEFQAGVASGSGDIREALIKKYADIADLLEPCLEGLSFLCNAVPNRLALPTDAKSPLQLDDFRIVGEVGRGGMGIVYEAEQVSLNRRVALKIFPMAAILGERQLARFHNEANAAAMLDHRHIISIYSVGCDKGVHYFAMQLIEGQDLAQIIEQLRNATTSEEDADEHSFEFLQQLIAQNLRRSGSGGERQRYYKSIAQLGIKAANALHYAHQEGVIHRDVKPANLLLDEDGEIYVSDFGLARIEAAPAMTMTGDVMGTLRYMSPEQAFGKQKVVDHRTDVYSLGVTLYELTTHHLPFDGDSRETLLKQITFDIATPPRRADPSIPKELGTILLKAIERKPEDRYSTAAELADDLQRFIDGRPIAASPLGSVAKTVRWAKRKPVTAILVTLIASLAVIGPLVAIRQTQLRHRAEAFQKQAKEEVIRANQATNQEIATREELRERLYRADMSKAYAAWDFGDVKRTLELLSRQRPTPSQVDYRSFEWRMLWNLSHPDVKLLKHSKAESDPLSPYALAISQDGRLLASGTYSGMINLWDLSEARMIKTFSGHTDRIEGLAFSPDGQQLASASLDKAVTIWQVATGKQTWKLRGHTGEVWAVAYSPTGDVLASGSADHSIQLWNPSTGKNLAILQGHTGEVTSVIFFPDGQTLASGSWDHSMRLWSLPSGESQAQFPQPSKVHGFAVSPDGGVLAVAQSWSDRFRLYDISAISDKRQAIELSDIYAHSAHISSTKFSPDGRLIATGSGDHTIRIWEKSSGRLLDTLRGHGSDIGAIEFLADSAHLVSSAHDNTLRIWNLSDSARSKLLNGGTELGSSGVTFSPDGRLLVSINNDSSGRIWDIESKIEIRRFEENGVFVDISPDGKVMALGLQTGEVQLQGTSTGEILKSYHEHQSWVCDIEFSPEGDLLASASTDGVLLIRRVSDGTVIHTETDYFGEQGTLEFFPDGKTVAWGSKKIVKIMDIMTGSIIAELPTQVQSTIVLTISPNGQMLATGSWGGTISLWNLSGTKPVLQAVTRGSKGHVYSLAFSSDSKVLVSGNQDGMLRFWDVATGENTGFLRCDAGEIWSMACSPNGKSLAVAGNDGSLRLYHADAIENGKSLKIVD